MTIFYDLFLFVKNSIYTDLKNAFELFDFFHIKIADSDLILADVFSVFLTLLIVGIIIWLLVSLFILPIKLIKGALK